MPTLVMLKGLPASGKTTVALNMVIGRGFRRVNRDGLRMMIDNGFYSRETESLIRDARNCIIVAALRAGYDVVVDDTNLKPENESELAYLCMQEEAKFEVFEMDTPLEECIRRDAGREHPVGEQVIRSMHDKYIKAKV